MKTWKRENEALSFNNAHNFLNGFYTTDKQWSKEKHRENYHDQKVEDGSPWIACLPFLCEITNRMPVREG